MVLSYKQQATSNKQLDMQLDLCYRIIKEKVMNDDINERSVNPLIRIANTLEEILRLVKKDQEDAEARRKQYETE
jgi:hypothetical protein